MFELQEDGGVVEISLHVHQHPAGMCLICLTLAKFQRDQSKVWCCWVVVIKVRKSSIFLLHHYQTCEQTLLALSAWTSMLRCQQFSEARITGIEIWYSVEPLCNVLLEKILHNGCFNQKYCEYLKKAYFFFF